MRGKRYHLGDVAAGDFHNLVVTLSGELLAWGNNTNGQVGDGTVIDRNHPITVVKDTGRELIAVEMCVQGIAYQALAQNESLQAEFAGSIQKSIASWANVVVEHVSVDLMAGSVIAKSMITPMPGFSIESLITGLRQTQNRLSEQVSRGVARLPGIQSVAVGDIGVEVRSIKAAQPAPEVWQQGVLFVAAGKAHSLAITEAGEVLAWGANEDGLLGTGWVTKQLVPKQIDIGTGAKAIAAGWHHSIVLTEDGDVLTWGGNEYGQLGNGSKMPQRVPIKVTLPGPAIAVSAGWHHSLALLESGEVLVWGFNAPDASGFRTDGLPRSVLRHSIKAISGGGVHSLALTESGILLAWGGNEKGQLGDGTVERQNDPVPVASGIEHIAAGSYHSLAVDKDNHALVWGFSMYSLPGPGGDSTWRLEYRPQAIPLDVETFAFHSVSGGGGHSLAVSFDGEVFCWGGNASGQVGDRSTTDAELPRMILSPGTIQIKSHEDKMNAIMSKNPGEVEDDQGSMHRAIIDKPRGHDTAGPRSSQLPELMMRAAGVTSREALARTQPPTRNPELADAAEAS